jgi:carbon-monoxide dehydrogenase small subunit
MTEPATEVTVELTVNGERRRVLVPARTSLADLLRDDLGLTGTHLGCEHGVCGACTVLLDGGTARSCVVLAAQASGSKVVTVEGLSAADGLSDVQAALARHGGLQCGFCTPGFVVAITELLSAERELDEAEVREELSGNICRCTGYQGIVRAVVEVSRRRAADCAAAGRSLLSPDPDGDGERRSHHRHRGGERHDRDRPGHDERGDE